GPDPPERSGGLLLTEDDCRATFRVAARDEGRVARDAEVLDDGEHVVGEPVPGVVDIGRVAVAVPPEVERPDAAPARDQSLRDRCPDEAVKAGRMREQDGRAGATPVVDDQPDPVRGERM